MVAGLDLISPGNPISIEARVSFAVIAGTVLDSLPVL